MRAYAVFDQKGNFVQASARKVNAERAARNAKTSVTDVQVDDATRVGKVEKPQGTLGIRGGLWVFEPGAFNPEAFREKEEKKKAAPAAAEESKKD